MKGEIPASDFKNLNKEELMEKCASLTNRFYDKKEREAKQNQIIKLLHEAKPLSFEEKLMMALTIYGDVKIKQKENTVHIEHSIHAGWCSFQAETVEEGLNKLLFLV
jgi:hypothetical protein